MVRDEMHSYFQQVLSKHCINRGRAGGETLVTVKLLMTALWVCFSYSAVSTYIHFCISYVFRGVFISRFGSLDH